MKELEKFRQSCLTADYQSDIILILPLSSTIAQILRFVIERKMSEK